MPLDPHEQARIDALHEASKEYRKLYGGSGKKTLREELRAGVRGTEEERARFAALERDYRAYERHRYQQRLRPPPRPPPLSRPAAAGSISALGADDGEAQSRRQLAQEYARKFLGARNREAKARFEAGAAEADELQRYHALKRAFNDVRNADNRAERAAWRELRRLHDRFVAEYLGPENAAKRERLEAGDASPAEREAYEAQRRAYERVEEADGGPIGLGRRKGQAKSRGTSNPPGRTLSAPEDMTEAEWAALRSASTAYRTVYINNAPLKRMLEAGGGTQEEQAAFQAARKAYNEYQARLPRRRMPKTLQQNTRSTWRSFLTPKEQQQLDAVEEDHRTYRRLRLSVRAERDAFLADDPDGTKRAQLEALHEAAKEYNRLYGLGRRAAERAAARREQEHTVDATDERAPPEDTKAVADRVTMGQPPPASSVNQGTVKITLYRRTSEAD